LESVEQGLSELVGTDPSRIVKAFARRMTEHQAQSLMTNPYGDGYASERILEHLVMDGITL
jgi:UDP-N-acetylglucosamine 2-epimerase (non-hydrolysing)